VIVSVGHTPVPRHFITITVIKSSIRIGMRWARSWDMHDVGEVDASDVYYSLYIIKYGDIMIKEFIDISLRPIHWDNTKQLMIMWVCWALLEIFVKQLQCL